jgi:hypothetical protein
MLSIVRGATQLHHSNGEWGGGGGRGGGMEGKGAGRGRRGEGRGGWRGQNDRLGDMVVPYGCCIWWVPSGWCYQRGPRTSVVTGLQTNPIPSRLDRVGLICQLRKYL